jgi:plasmid segregation protein ParM
MTSPDDIIIAGNDIGYGFNKLIACIIGQSTRRNATLPSLIGPSIGIKYHADLIGNGKPVTITTDGQSWFYGEAARLQSPFTISPRARDRDPETMRILMLAALHQAGITDGDIKMVTGLPVEWYSDRQALEQTLFGPHLFTIDDQPHKIQVLDVLVVPQPFGSYVKMVTDRSGDLTDPHGLARQKVAVVDIGMHTTDFTLFDAMRYREPLSGSIPTAMARYYDLIQRGVERETGFRISLEEAEHAASTHKIHNRGEKQRIGDLVIEAWESVAKKIVGKAQTLWDEEERTIAAVLVTGGGAEQFHSAVEDVFPQARLLDEPQMSNAEGFYRYGLRKFTS